jgi:hypothetical protein
MDADEPAELDQDGTVRWRRELLEKAGYVDEDADAIAGRLDIDVRAALDLRCAGCPSRTALEILF